MAVAAKAVGATEAGAQEAVATAEAVMVRGSRAMAGAGAMDRGSLVLEGEAEMVRVTRADGMAEASWETMAVVDTWALRWTCRRRRSCPLPCRQRH